MFCVYPLKYTHNRWKYDYHTAEVGFFISFCLIPSNVCVCVYRCCFNKQYYYVDEAREGKKTYRQDIGRSANENSEDSKNKDKRKKKKIWIGNKWHRFVCLWMCVWLNIFHYHFQNGLLCWLYYKFTIIIISPYADVRRSFSHCFSHTHSIKCLWDCVCMT